MFPIPIDKASLVTAQLYGESALFSNVRLVRGSIPKGIYAYDLREDNGTPVTVENYVACDYFGTVILKEALVFNESGYKAVAGNDFVFLGEHSELSAFHVHSSKEKHES